MKEIFALDIGTRKVMGIIARKHDDVLEIVDTEVIEHAARPMLDGQIHSIEEVARTVKKIKENLEARLHKKLEQVGVAVAGRNLLTYRSKAAREFPVIEDITPEMVKDLELEAVDKMISDAAQDLSQFYCVGYCPVYYELDGNRITDLTGHRGKSIAAELIITFLPRVVLDSMFAVLKKARLEATNITLEPIAAVHAIIPKEMRSLNIVLLDIGAGTSDLALTRNGLIFAFGMVPEAGDEITESVSEHLLVDFSTAEMIKRAMCGNNEIEFEDIWGRARRIDTAALQQVLKPRVRKFAEAVAAAGRDLNGGVPHAVVAVGGGSLTHGLMDEIAASFDLDRDKVGIRLPAAIKGIKDKTGKLNGPEAVTPLGIALMTAHALGLRFVDIEVNRKKYRLIDLQQKKDVMGALALAGIINQKKLYPRPGMALTVEVNGELKIIKGTLGEPARVLLNGSPVSSLSEKIEESDIVEFVEAKNGKDAVLFVKDLSEIKPVEVIFNRQAVTVLPSVTVNGKAAVPAMQVPDRAVIKTVPVKVRDVLKSRGIQAESLSERQILVNINSHPKVLTQRNFTLSLNKSAGGLDAEVSDHDVIDFQADKPTHYRINDVMDIPARSHTMRITVNDKNIDVSIDPVQIFLNGHQVKPEEFLIDGAEIRVYYLKERKILLSEIFRYIDVDTRDLSGKRINIMVDDQPAGFTTPLSEGARVKIQFEDRQ